MSPPLFRAPPGDPREGDCTPSTSFACGNAGSGFYHRHFRPDPQVGGPPYTELGAFGGDREVVDSDYFFPLIDGGRDIRIQHVRNGIGGFDSVITITASTDADANVDGDGKIDVLTNGFVHIVEWSGDLRAGEIISTDDDVTLYSPRRILDAETGDAAADAPDPDGDPTAIDVGGVDIVIHAGSLCTAAEYDCNGGGSQGGIGTPGNFLEIDSDRNGVRGTVTGTLRAMDVEANEPSVDSTLGIFITEMVGDLNVELVHTVLGDVSLATSVGTGSIVDANDDDLPDVIGNSIDLDANGTDADIGDADGLNDLEIDSSVTFQGDVGLQAGRHIDVTEYDGTLYLVLAHAELGHVRLTVRETSDLDEDLVIVPGSVLFAENAPITIPVAPHRGGDVRRALRRRRPRHQPQQPDPRRDVHHDPPRLGPGAGDRGGHRPWHGDDDPWRGHRRPHQQRPGAATRDQDPRKHRRRPHHVRPDGARVAHADVRRRRRHRPDRSDPTARISSPSSCWRR